jgi:hypothetical protein
MGSLRSAPVSVVTIHQAKTNLSRLIKEIGTHVLIGWFYGDSRLSNRVRNSFRDPDTTILVSAASA